MHRHRHKRANEAQPPSATAATTTQSTVAKRGKDQKGKLVSPEEIRLHAYRRWENAGKPIGDGIQFWLEAEQELGLRK